MKNLTSSLRFIDYIVEEVIFRANPLYHEEKSKIDFDIDSSIEIIDEKSFVVSLAVNIFKNPKNNNYPFSMDIKISGYFETDTTTISDETKKDFMEKNSVAILFPYVRALISSFSSVSNVKPLILPPINVVRYIENKSKYRKNVDGE